MFLKRGEFIGASIPQHLFQVSQTCKECQQPAELTILITGAWGTYRKISLCRLHWEQTEKQNNANEFESLKIAAAQKPEPSRHKPDSVVLWPPKLKHAAFILTLFLTGAGTATSQTQTGQLSVTARIESSVAYSQGQDGKWTLIVANVKDSPPLFVPKLSKAAEQERSKKRASPTVRQQQTGARTSSSTKSITKPVRGKGILTL
jgi:hypothetical protein